MSKEIPMNQAEFDAIKAGLQAAPAEEGIELTEKTISGKRPLDWHADYVFAGDLLTVKGRGFFGGKVETALAERLNAELVKMRGA